MESNNRPLNLLLPRRPDPEQPQIGLASLAGGDDLAAHGDLAGVGHGRWRHSSEECAGAYHRFGGWEGEAGEGLEERNELWDCRWSAMYCSA